MRYINKNYLFLIQLASLEVERAALVSQVEQMQKEMEEQKEAAMGWGHEEAGVDVAGQTHSSPDPDGKETKHKWVMSSNTH